MGVLKAGAPTSHSLSCSSLMTSITLSPTVDPTMDVHYPCNHCNPIMRMPQFVEKTPSPYIFTMASPWTPPRWLPLGQNLRKPPVKTVPSAAPTPSKGPPCSSISLLSCCTPPSNAFLLPNFKDKSPMSVIISVGAQSWMRLPWGGGEVCVPPLPAKCLITLLLSSSLSNVFRLGQDEAAAHS